MSGVARRPDDLAASPRYLGLSACAAFPAFRVVLVPVLSPA